jgi:cytochrome P450
MRSGAQRLGATVTLEELDRDPHPTLARLREREPVAWIDVLDGWLVTRYDLVLEVMRDAETYTVDDPRFSTARVIGPSMLSLDGEAHAHHRAPFVGPFRPREVKERFAQITAAEAARLIQAVRPDGGAELRTAFAGPLAASIVTQALGLDHGEAPVVLGWYRAIVSAVTEITAGREIAEEAREAFEQLNARLQLVIDGEEPRSLLAVAAGGSSLSHAQVVSNAAVLLFGGIETTEGMIANALLELLQDPAQLERARSDERVLDGAIEESLRLEPAAAVIDRYATADARLDGQVVRAGQLVRLSIAGANRDPAVFDDPDTFDPTRANARRHLAFAQGPHVCVGVHLARLESRVGVGQLLSKLQGLRLDPARTPEVSGLVFRKPAALNVLWDG